MSINNATNINPLKSDSKIHDDSNNNDDKEDSKHATKCFDNAQVIGI